MRIGYEMGAAHSLVDDHSRYAYSELHRERARRDPDRIPLLPEECDVNAVLGP
jgi:hypothetical protein